MIPQATFDPSARLDLYFRIGRVYSKDFQFIDANSDELDITSHTFTLFVKRSAGDRKNVFALTLGNGLEFKTYEEGTLTATVTSDQTDVEEGEYFWELVSTDLNETWLNGNAYFHNGVFDGV